MFSVFCVVLLFIFKVSAQETPLSPCPGVFAYQHDGQSWYGVITVRPPYPSNLALNLRMDVPQLLPTNYYGRVEMLGERSEIVLSLTNGRPIRYRVDFPTLDYIPYITSIVFNGNEICRGPRLNSGVRTSVELKHDLKTNLNGNNGGFQNIPQDFYPTQPINVISNGINQNNPPTNLEVFTNDPSIFFEDTAPGSINPSNPWLNGQSRPNEMPWNQNNATSNINPTNPWLQDVNRRPQQPSFQNQPNPPRQPYPQNNNNNINQARPQMFSPARPPATTTTRPYQMPANERPNPDTFAMVSNRRTTTQSPVPISPENDRSETRNKCGMSKKLNNALIIRGETTNKGEWPWLAAIFVKKVSSLNFVCGGTLVSKELVITAAHCLGEKNNRQVRKEEVIVRLGAYNLQDWVDDSKPHAVQELILPPSFDGGLVLRNDIALLRINRIDYTDYILPACLWTSNLDINSYYGTFGTIIGWGRTENGLVASPEPKLTNQRIVTNEECRDSDPAFNTLTSSTTVCAGNRNGTGPCNGDSGGGMFINVNGKWTLRGIVSTSLSLPDAPNNCNLANYIVFTDVSKFIQWIEYYF